MTCGRDGCTATLQFESSSTDRMTLGHLRYIIQCVLPFLDESLSVLQSLFNNSACNFVKGITQSAECSITTPSLSW